MPGPAGRSAISRGRTASCARAGPRRALPPPAVQVRTWNLSSLWRLPRAGADAWLKVVPPFFAHEGADARLSLSIARWWRPLIAARRRRACSSTRSRARTSHDAPLARQRRMVEVLVGLQVEWAGRLPELAAGLGVCPTGARRSCRALARDPVARARSPEVDAPARAPRWTPLLDGLARRFEELAGCGIADSPVHGDFHPGNFRGRERRLVLLDWGDCGIGLPLLDQARLPRSVARPGGARSRPLAGPLARLVPAADPERAAALIAPVAAAARP